MTRGKKLGLAIVASVTAVVVAAGAASGVLTLSDGRSPQAAPPSAPAGGESAPPAQPVADTPVLTPTPEPEALLERGDPGRKVRELQARLSQIAWYTPPMSGRFDRTTRRAVSGFQEKRGFEVTGEVDERTWRRLLRMTRKPTDDEMFNRAGPTLFGPGDSGPAVREIQARLRQIGWLSGDVTDDYGQATTTAVTGFQAKRMVPATGKVDQRTLDLLEGMTTEPTRDELLNRFPAPASSSALDPRCTTGRVLCIDKSSNSLRWVVDGDVLVTVDVRFGSAELPTREGQFSVYHKSRDHVSSLYDTPMPYAMFFSGGQAVHYSPDFAANGYNGASHGCVNVRDYSAIQMLFDQVQNGDKVIVYWS